MAERSKFVDQLIVSWTQWSLTRKIVFPNLLLLTLAFAAEHAFDFVEYVGHVVKHFEGYELDTIFLWLPFGLASIAGIMFSERMRAVERSRMSHTASLTDMRTGLSNLRALGHYLQSHRTEAMPQRLAILVRVANRSAIESLVGTQASNQLIVELVRRLTSMLGIGTRTFRISDDQLCILCTENVSSYMLPELNDRVAEASALAVRAGAFSAWVRLQTGFVYLSPDDADPDRILESARALRVDPMAIQARLEGKVALYDDKMHARLAETVLMEQALSDAVEADLIEPHFQPIVALPSRRVVELECLARWRNADGRFVAACDFMPTAARLGHMKRIDMRMFELAMFQSRQLQQSVALSFNISEQTLWAIDAIDEMLAMARSAGFDPARIVFELTESIVDVLNERGASDVLQRVRAEGCTVVIDDFGVERSSIARLASLPINKIKLDRGLVESIARDPRQRLVAKATIDMAHSLGLTVVAEGVETEDQVYWLEEMKCDFAQGYLFARAQRLSAFPHLLQA
jgi:diguanylate cyclase